MANREVIKARYNWREFKRILIVKGFVEVRTTGKHHVWKHIDGRMVTLPTKHKDNDLISGPIIKRVMGAQK